MRISDWSSDVCSSDLDIPLNVALPSVENRYIEAQLAIEQVSLEACFDIAYIFRLEGWSDRVSQIPPPSLGGAARLRIYAHRVVHFRSQEGRVGKDGVSPLRSRCSPYP